MKYKLSELQIQYVEDVYKKMKHKLSVECDRIGEIIPYIAIDGKYTDMSGESINWWTNGFWAGIMWQLYHETKIDKYKNAAIGVEKRLDDAFVNYESLHHDVGFMWLHTSVAHYRQTGDMAAKRKGLFAASVLASRYNMAGEYIRAWNPPSSSSMIVDCLMNLPLLYWATEQVDDPRFLMIAKQHTKTALNYIFRPDGSCNHVIEFDQYSGEFLDNPGGQGYAKGSAWSRGHAWGIYGMALAYGYTKEAEYLDAAKKVAHYFIANVALTNYISVIDFRGPVEPVYYDTTATACAACGLLEIGKHVNENEKNLYVNTAFQMLKALVEHFVDWDVTKDGILQGGSVKYHDEEEREVPIVYGDYFLLELVLRLQDKNFNIW